MAEEEIELDIVGKPVTVPRDTVRALAAAAAARAGLSSRHRELSLALGRAFDSGRVSLGRDEERALRAVLEERGLTLPEQHGAGRGADTGG
jgi:hypothetical protein